MAQHCPSIFCFHFVVNFSCLWVILNLFKFNSIQIKRNNFVQFWIHWIYPQSTRKGPCRWGCARRGRRSIGINSWPSSNNIVPKKGKFLHWKIWNNFWMNIFRVLSNWQLNMGKIKFIKYFNFSLQKGHPLFRFIILARPVFINKFQRQKAA